MLEYSTVAPRALPCPRCRTPLAAEESWQIPVKCPSCQSALDGAIFPALQQPRRTAVRSEAAQEGEAACFFHPEKKAALACESCGRFICGLCSVELGGRSLCATCLGYGLGSGKLAELVQSRFLWSQLSLVLGFFPLICSPIIWPLLPFSGAAAIFAAIYGWKKPGSLVHGRRRWAAVLGVVCAAGQLIVFSAFALLVWRSST